MLILSAKDIHRLGINWKPLIDTIEYTVQCMSRMDFAQPVKPYLRYRNLKNRIIAMPAFVGGDVNIAGIKWIASFPGNIDAGIPRAHSVIILNDADTGVPVAILNTALLSIIRTAAVSGVLLRRFKDLRRSCGLHVAIIGFGPIGQYHLKMCRDVLKEQVHRVSVYDIRQIRTDTLPSDVDVVSSWQEAYRDADVVITCTVSDAPYINTIPKSGSLHLNVSLRDYCTEVYDFFRHSIIVDSWEEVCREKTDIERMHDEKGLKKEDTKSLIDVVVNDCLVEYPRNAPILFNPMGMACFDIAVGNLYYRAAERDVQLRTSVSFQADDQMPGASL